MTTQEIIRLIAQIKIILPTIQVPELSGKTEEEKKAIMSVYIMQFGNLNYDITLKAINKITKDDDLMKKFEKAPIPTLARESVKLTEFTDQEKKKYIESKEIIFAVNADKKMMEACDKHYAHRLPEYDRKMTPLEEDFYCYNKMSYHEYWYWKDLQNGKDPKKPNVMCYNPNTRRNKVNEELLGAINEKV